MSARRVLTAAAAAASAVAALLLPLPPGSATAASSNPACDGPLSHVVDATGHPVPPVDSRQPVLLVHGFNGGPGITWNGAGGIASVLEAPGSGYFTGRFDYSKLNQQWVTDPGISGTPTHPGLLANVLDCMATESRAADGSGKVIVVTYSMGGLAAQQALAETVGGRPVAGDVGGLVSIGVPWQGLDPNFNLVTVLLGYYCGAGVGAAINVQVCPLLRPGGLGSPAARAIVNPSVTGMSAAMGNLPKIPAAIPVLAVAGNLRWTSNRFDDSWIYGGSDGVVSVVSATSPPMADGGSGQLSTAVVPCDVDDLLALVTASHWSGCFHIPLPDDPAVAAQVSPVLAQWRAALNLPALAGTWTGTYVCAQGETGLRLVIQQGAGGALTATFNFYAVPANPGVPSGSYTMTGSYSATGVQLTQNQWITQPPGYEMVDISASPPAQGGTVLSGSITTCGTDFTLTRS